MTAPLARRLLIIALALGAAGDWLLRVEEWRLGFVVWLLGIIAVAFAMSPPSSESDPSHRRERALLLGAAAVLALLLVVRDAATLYALDFFALLVVTALIAWRALGSPLAALVPRDAVVGGVATAASVIAGAPTLALRDASFREIEPTQRRTARGFALGSLVAAPVLLVVTLLLASADPLFAGFLENAASILDTNIAEHLIVISALTWVTAGALRGSRVPLLATIPGAQFQPRWPFAVGAPLLGGLSLILSAWVGLQVRTLFGGSAYVAETSGVTAAEYARQGFFELIVIAGIVLAVLLVIDEVLDRDDARGRAGLRSFGLVLVGLVGLVLTSAVQRLALYVSLFGLTDDRMLALAVLVWVAMMLGWFAWTVLRAQRQRFAPGVLVLSAVWLVAFNASNPERIVVETNLRRAELGQEFDVAYHVKLSGDALPSLLDGLTRLPAAPAAELREALRVQWAERGTQRADWREWSLPFVRGLRRAPQ